MRAESSPMLKEQKLAELKTKIEADLKRIKKEYPEGYREAKMNALRDIQNLIGAGDKSWDIIRNIDARI